MPIDDGGPAFPLSSQAVHDWAVAQSPDAYIDARARAAYGMSMRAYFAGRALQGLVAGPAAQDICDHDSRYDGTNFAQVVARNCREFADALIAELKEGE